VELERSLAAGPLQPVYLVYGPERFLRAEAVRLIREALLREAENTDIMELDAADIEPARLFDDLRTPPLFAPKRLLIVEPAAQLLVIAADLIVEYMKKPTATAALILVAESVDGRRKGMKALLQNAAAVECPAMKQRELPAWCVSRARFHGKRMEPAAARLLVDLAGANLGRLDGHLQSLAAFCRERQRITSADVSDLIGGDHAQTVWELARAISARSSATALRALDRLFREPRTRPLWIIAALARETRDLWQARCMLERGCDAAHIRKRLGKPEWLVRRILQSIRNSTAERLRADYGLLLQADMDCKTGGGSDDWIVERLVLQLCGSTETKGKR